MLDGARCGERERPRAGRSTAPQPTPEVVAFGIAGTEVGCCTSGSWSRNTRATSCRRAWPRRAGDAAL
eukprot:8283610-Lingulodinium_polyedra.AAC.1